LSEIRATTISDAAGTGPITLTGQSAAKGFFASSAPGVTDQSLNISSAADYGSGYHGVSFTNNFSNDDYASPSSASWRRSEYSTSISSSGIRYYLTDPNSSETATVDYATSGGLTAAFFGDLA